ncbi:hypothetical protein N7G274_006548 [Stereocaulon virgatum]|uniref:DUF6594 domain-containing protein n=1 Tax=Stereocaulon virgatum TaxID=373712 RepID=A0ABR4A503_9LECA
MRYSLPLTLRTSPSESQGLQDNETFYQDPESSTMAASSPLNNRSLPDSMTPNPSKPSKEAADIQPWRYRGYPAFSRWLASDDDFFLLRRFGCSSARVALFLQDQVARCEIALKAHDIQAMQASLDSGTFRNDQQEHRPQAMEDLATVLERYQKFVLQHMALKSYTRATKFQLSNVKQWLANANGPIEPEEVEFLQEEDDLIPVASKPKAPLRRFIDRHNFLTLPACLRERSKNARLFTEEDFEMQTTVYNNDRALDKVVTFITVLLGLAMIIGPLWLLQYLATHRSNLQARLGVITGFLALFTTLTSLFTVAKPFEVLAATAAYGAILMVFMQFGTYPTASNNGG